METQEFKTMEYIKQLEKENKLLKRLLMKNILSENMGIIRLNLTISILKKRTFNFI